MIIVNWDLIKCMLSTAEWWITAIKGLGLMCDSYGSQVDTVQLETGYCQKTTANCQKEVIVSITIVNRQSHSWLNRDMENSDSSN